MDQHKYDVNEQPIHSNSIRHIRWYSIHNKNGVDDVQDEIEANNPLFPVRICWLHSSCHVVPVCGNQEEYATKLDVFHHRFVLQLRDHSEIL
jgi:hypothetical protein